MLLCFLRHGKAEERGQGLSDAARRLTPRGIAEMEEAAAGLGAAGIKIQTLYTSPLVRAAETARIVAPALGIAQKAVRTEDCLASGSLTLGALQSLLEGPNTARNVLLVGHEPDFSEMVGLLTGAALELKKGGLAVVETHRIEPRAGTLCWLLTSEHLSLMGGASKVS